MIELEGAAKEIIFFNQDLQVAKAKLAEWSLRQLDGK